MAKLLESGLDPAPGPEVQVPVIKDLAITARQQTGDLDGDAYAVVESFLSQVIQSIAPAVAALPKRMNVTPQQAIDGLQELLGIGKSGYDKRKMARAINAGRAMGYSHDTFRTAESDGKDIVDVLIPTHLTDGLVAVARAHDFNYSFQSTTDGRTALERIGDKPQLANGEWALMASLLARDLFDEVQALCHSGFPACVKQKRSIKRIATLAKRAGQGRAKRGTFARDLEDVLLWIVGQVEDSDQRRAILALLDLDEERGFSLEERRARAAACLGYENSQRFQTAKEGKIIHFIRSQFVVLAGELDCWPDVDMRLL